MDNTVAMDSSKAGALDLLLEKIYQDGGYDFRDYKRGTVVRRLEKRLQAAGAKTYLDYMQFLDTHPEEYERLVYTLTIAVSGFFRGDATFECINEVVLPELVSHKTDRDERGLRFWSTASARGEEPYSIAITLAEFLGDRLGDFDIQIYATDINRQILKEARTGIYSPKEVENLPSNILESYFTATGDGYAMGVPIKEIVHFSYFDLASAIKPPFTGIDCVFCRNVLIYLGKQLQERLLGMLYEVLATPGYLVLGEVETPTDNLRTKLECLGAKAKIYKKSRGGK